MVQTVQVLLVDHNKSNGPLSNSLTQSHLVSPNTMGFSQPRHIRPQPGPTWTDSVEPIPLALIHSAFSNLYFRPCVSFVSNVDILRHTIPIDCKIFNLLKVMLHLAMIWESEILTSTSTLEPQIMSHPTSPTSLFKRIRLLRSN